MPNRILKESICASDSIDSLTAFQETFFYRLIVNCDDYGRMDARPKVLASRLYPLKDIRSGQVEEALRALSSAELVTLYEVDGKPFVQMRTWERHQQIRSKKSKYPACDGTCKQLISDDSRCLQTIADASKCARNPIQSESESNPNMGAASARTPRARFTPPMVDEVRAYCLERRNGVDPQRFIDHYAANGWVRGKTKISDWRACVRTWEQRDGRGPRAEAEPQPTNWADVFGEGGA